MQNITNMSINIHGKTYITVAERVAEAHKELKELTITTEVLFQEPVVIKATVTTLKGVFTGISAANPSKAIEKMSPYEVAETSAIGRALGFAGYGIVEGIATADEIVKAEKSEVIEDDEKEHIGDACPKCKVGKLIAKTSKAGKTFLKCDKGGWDFDLNQATGCSYVNWRNPKKDYESKAPYADKTKAIAAEDYDLQQEYTG